MGQFASKKPRLEVTDVDRAVLTLKTQARKLEQQWQRIQGNVDREQQVARELVAQGKKDRALLALKRKKLQEGQAARLEAFILNVDEMLLNIESAKNQARIFAALKEGNSALKDVQKEMPLEDVERLMQDSADAKAYEDSLRQLLGESLNPEEAEAAEAELEELEQQLADEQGLEMPRVPSLKAAQPTAEAAVAAGAQQAAGQAAEQAAEQAEQEQEQEEQLPELPSVPKTVVTLPAETEAEAEEASERVMLAA